MAEPLTVILASVTVVSVAACVYKAIERVASAPRELVRTGGESVEGVIRTLSGELSKLFGSEPRISLNRKVLQMGGSAIRELALYKETILIREEWLNTSWKSTKQLWVEQPFTVKAGFDLNRLRFEVDGTKDEVVVTVPDATIVNVEYAGEFEVVREEHGLLNRITTRERDAVLNSLARKAQEEAEKLPLRDKAIEQLKLLLRPVLPGRFELIVQATDENLYFKEAGVLPETPL
ncbi:MAG TPA: DUF4230 domain-containing protein [Verrucomicrobiae bacterium]|nr:DUF4230 domain-containing protein [Verrucomicrobiae bacterium]